MKKIKRSDVFLLFSALGLGLLVWAFWPAQMLVQSTIMTPKPYDATPDVTLPQALVEARKMVIEAPQSLRLGETGIVRLTIAPDPDGMPLSNVTVGEDYNAMLQARLEGDENAISPLGTQEEPLRAGGEAIFTWETIAQGGEGVETTLWAYINLVPAAGGDEIRWPVLSLPVNIPVVSLFGLPLSTVKIAGIALLALGIALAGYSRLVLSSRPEKKLKKK